MNFCFFVTFLKFFVKGSDWFFFIIPSIFHYQNRKAAFPLWGRMLKINLLNKFLHQVQEQGAQKDLLLFQQVI